MRAPKVSVLVGSRDRPHVLKRCLDSIFKQKYENFEVLVLDDGSKEPYDSLLKGEYPVKLFRVEEPRGVAGGRNYLMRKAEGKIFVFIDDDAYFENDNALSRIVRAFESESAVAILAFKVIDHRDEKQDYLVPFSKRVRRQTSDIIEKHTYVSYYLGTGHALRGEAIDQCGGYQDDLIYGEEELDLSYRVIRCGYKIKYCPQVVVHHHPEPSILDQKSGVGTELSFHVRNRILIAYKYLPIKYWPSYLAIWLGRYLLDALRENALDEWWRGFKSGLKSIRISKREVLHAAALRYLKRYYGRLYY